MVVTGPPGLADHQYHDLGEEPPAGPGQASVVRRRAPIACRRCRRMRSKCVHESAQPPCKACAEAGLTAADCEFSPRGQPDDDRQYRHPRVRTNKSTKKDTAKNRRSTLDSQLGDPNSPGADDWDSLPPLNEVIEGVNRFTQRYFQLGFIPKQQFPERLRKDPRSVNLFLVLSILSISARLTSSLANRYGGGVEAAEFFMQRAAALARVELYKPPTLERCQAYYLLSIAQQGNAERNESHINMGIAMRLATLMRLHREETYEIHQPTPEVVIQAESARRTLWMLHSQDNLHSGPDSPVSLSACDITALLPCDETNFAAGRIPQSRAALADTPAAIENPALMCDPNRSLFASLMQAHHYWGIVGRQAANYSRSSFPWDPESEYSQMVAKLDKWEKSLPPLHTWSMATLQHRKAEGLDLAYLGVTMVARLCNIVARRAYLPDIINMGRKPPHEQQFYHALSHDLFYNVCGLHEQIDTHFTSRDPDDGVGAQMAAFCVYSCALLSAWFYKYPQICPNNADPKAGENMFTRCRNILLECKSVWPLASRWLESLDNFSRNTDMTEGSMADGKDHAPDIIRRASSVSSSAHSSMYRQPNILEHLPPHYQAQQQILSPSQPQPNLFPQQQNTFPYHPSPHVIQAPQQNQVQPGPMSFAPAHEMAPVQSLNGLNMMMPGTFDQSQSQNTVVSTVPFEMSSATAIAATTAGGIPYYMNPISDGFEDELQDYISGPGGTTQWMQAGGWMLKPSGSGDGF